MRSRQEARNLIEAGIRHGTPSDHADKILLALCEWAVLADDALMSAQRAIVDLNTRLTERGL